MSNALANLAAMTVASTGTGTITLGAAATINGVTYLSFAAAGVLDGALVYYSINDVGQSEIGYGTYTSSGTTLTRTVTNSTNSNTAINMTAAAIVRVTPGTSQFQEILLADRDYYVRTDGSDTLNTGLANSAGGAFLTAQKAVDTAAAINLSIYQVNINIVNGTYTGAVTAKSYTGAGPINIIGDTTWTNPASGSPGVVWNVTSNNGLSMDTVRGKYTIRGIKITTTTTGHHLSVTNGSTLDFRLLEFGAIASGYANIVNTSSTILISGGYLTSGGGTPDSHMNCAVNAVIRETAATTICMTGSPAWGTAGLICTNSSIMRLLATTINQISGSATGKRYNVDYLSATLTGGITFPGSVAGTADAATFGLYS